MRTPEEIKNELKRIIRVWSGFPAEVASRDALTYIEQLEAQLAKQNNLIDVLEDKSDENA